MAITKLVEFAKEGSKSIAGLVLLSGFPREEKPAREWFNYLFNATFTSINSLIDELEQMRLELDYLKKNGALPDEPDSGGTPPPDAPPAAPDPEGGNISGDWVLTQLTSPIKGNTDYLDIGNVVYLARHSSGRKVKDVVMTWKQNPAPIIPGAGITTYSSAPKDTDDKGETTFTFKSQFYVKQAPTATVTIAAPNNATLTKAFTLFIYTPS